MGSRILIYGSTYITECVVEELKRHFNLVGYVPSENPVFPGKIDLKLTTSDEPHDIKLSIQYDKKIEDHHNAYNLHTGLLPEYGGCNILHHTLKNGAKEQGLTFHKMTGKFDEGEIISKMTYPVLETDTVADLYERMATVAPLFAVNTLKLLPIKGEAKKPTIYKRESNQAEVDTINARINSACKVIAVAYCPSRAIRGEAKFPDHNQVVSSSGDHLTMWQFLADREIEVDAGMPVDTIIIVNGTDLGFWDKYNGVRTRNGVIKVLYRPNIGGSFGAYDFAFQNTKYRYYLFTEDDLPVLGDGYYTKLLSKLGMGVGFVGLIGVSAGFHPQHCHGAVGLTSRAILERVCSNNKGSLPYSKLGWDRQNVIQEGEIPFTNEIVRLGYQLIPYGKPEWSKDNLVYPYFNYVQKI